MQIKLAPLYKIGEIEKEKVKKILLSKTRAIFGLPLNFHKKRADLLNAQIFQNINRVNQESISIEMVKTSSSIMNSRFKSSFTTFGKSKARGNRGHIFGEVDIEMAYGIIKTKIDDDLQIEAEEIFSEQFDYFRINDEFKAINVIIII